MKVTCNIRFLFAEIIGKDDLFSHLQLDKPQTWSMVTTITMCAAVRGIMLVFDNPSRKLSSNVESAQYNDLDRVKALLKKGVSANMEDSAGYISLHYAARNGHYEVCKLLLESNAKVNAQTRCGHATALHRAAMQGHVNIVQLLLKSGANPNLKDADGYTALHKSLLTRSLPVCKLLIPCTDLTLSRGGKLDIEEFAKEKCPDIVSFLLTHVNTQGEIQGNR